MLEESAGGRYESTLCIIDLDALMAIAAHYAAEAPALADQLFAGFQECEGDLRSIGFHRSDMDWVQLIWLAPIILGLWRNSAGFVSGLFMFTCYIIAGSV